jgi:subtilisin family serine protease
MGPSRITWCAGLIALVALADGHAQPAVDESSPYRISLRNLEPFTPAAGMQLEVPGRDTDDASMHALVQLDVAEFARARAAPGSQETLRRLFGADPGAREAGIVLQRNLQRATYVAVIRSALAEELIQARTLAPLDDDVERLIRWVGPVPGAIKLESTLRNGRYERWGLGPDNTFRLLVTFYEDAIDQADAVLAPIAVEHARYTSDTWRVVLPRDALDGLVAEDSVRSIAQGPRPFSGLNNAARMATNVETLQGANVSTNPPVYSGLSGRGTSLALLDSGIDLDHDDFWEHDALGHRTVSRVTHHTGTGSDRLHGTHVAGVMAGSGYQSEANGGGPYQWRGMAPEASMLSFEGTAVDSGGHTATMYDAIVLSGADVSNNSYEQSGCLIYDGIAATVDKLIHGTETWEDGTPIPPRAAVWGAGNNGAQDSGCENYGYFGLTVASKNPIVVGEVGPDGVLLAESSLGPTYDGRLKPDVVAPGCIRSTHAENGYELLCGTSAAAPVVTGIVALLLQKWREVFDVSGTCSATSGSECFPFPSTLKAVLIQGATDLSGVLVGNHPEANEGTPEDGDIHYATGPDYATGYGLVNASASAEIVAAGVGAGGRIVEAEISAATNVPDEYNILVPVDAQRLRVTLAWDDPPSDVELNPTDRRLLHDLDLELVSPDPVNNVFLPWVVTPVQSVFQLPGEYPGATDVINDTAISATRQVDTLNNVEQVEVPFPAEGVWRVRVKGSNLPFGGSQKYSLASDYAVGTFLFFSNAATVPPGAPADPCVEMPWSPSARALQFTFARGSPCAVVPFEPICRYVVNCRFCERFGLCPEIRLTLRQVPAFFGVSVRRRDGSTAARDDSGDPTRSLRWRLADGEKYGLFFVPSRDARPAGAYTIEVALEELRREFVDN